MAYVITQRCCNDATCIAECPVDCIRPAPDDPRFAAAEMLYIEPNACIDCGACADSCPVSAIFPEEELSQSLLRYRDINAEYFEENPLEPNLAPLAAVVRPSGEAGPLRVAIVGAGAAAAYAVQELLDRGGVEVDVFERLPVPWGLIRTGVAPDHPETKQVADGFDETFSADDRVRVHLNVELGKDVTHAEIAAHHHAVIYAVGAATDNRLGIAGEDLPGSHSATEFVAWYNGHPDYAGRIFDLSGPRAVVVGNGNVALDVARILATDPDRLAKTDIAEHALKALRTSAVEEIVILGRRGPGDAAYTSPEFLALGALDDVDIVIDPEELGSMDNHGLPFPGSLKSRLAHEYAARPSSGSRKRIVFRYLVSPVEILGGDRVEGVGIARTRLVDSGSGARTEPTTEVVTLETGLVLRSVGYRGEPVPGLAFDPQRHVVPNDGGRVEAGVYVTGWIKRGATGGIGSNRADAVETVDRLIGDYVAGLLEDPAATRAALADLVRRRRPDALDWSGWRNIDDAERAAGAAAGRPRVKLTSTADLLRAAAG